MMGAGGSLTSSSACWFHSNSNAASRCPENWVVENIGADVKCLSHFSIQLGVGGGELAGRRRRRRRRREGKWKCAWQFNSTEGKNTNCNIITRPNASYHQLHKAKWSQKQKTVRYELNQRVENRSKKRTMIFCWFVCFFSLQIIIIKKPKRVKVKP